MASLLTFAAATASAQETDSLRTPDSLATSAKLRAMYLLPPPAARATPTYYKAVPAITILSPSGYGAEAGEIFGGVGFQARTRYTHQVDGVVAVGFGVGDATRTLGFETDVISYGTIRSGFGRHVGVSFKASRMIFRRAGIAAGLDNAFHSSGIDGSTSIYLSGSNAFYLRDARAAPFSKLTVTLGAGSGRFHSERTYTDQRNGVGIFGSLALRLARPVSAIVDWSGQNLTLALSLVPFPGFPIVITPGLTDITRNSGDGARFVVGAGTGVRISRLQKILGGKGESK